MERFREDRREAVIKRRVEWASLAASVRDWVAEAEGAGGDRTGDGDRGLPSAVARRLGIRVVGTLRVVEMTHEAGAIPDLRAVQADLLRRRLRIAPRLLDESLEKYGLTPIGDGGGRKG